MEINQGNIDGLTTAFRAIYQNAFAAAKPSWQTVAMLMRSTTSANNYRFLELLPGMREWLGDREIKNISSHGFIIENKSFENTVSVSRPDIEDDQYGIYDPMFADLGQTAAEHPDELVYNLLNQAGTLQCYDGQFFFDTDHPVVDANGVEQSVSNYTAGAFQPWYLLDDTRPYKPLIFQERKAPVFVSLDGEKDVNVFNRNEFIYGVDSRCNVGLGLWQLIHKSRADLTADNVQAAIEAMQTMTGPNGRPLNLRPSRLIVGAANRKKALEIVKAERLANGATNVLAGELELSVETRIQ